VSGVSATQFDTAKIAALLARASDKKLATTTRGNALEELVKYLFDSVPGLTFDGGKIKDDSFSREFDLLYMNSSNLGVLAKLHYAIPIEAKAWDDPVGSPQVGWFFLKLKLGGCGAGILVATSGITGQDADLKYAGKIVDQADREGHPIIVIGRDDLSVLATSDDLVKLIQERFMKVHAGQIQ
jgi:hypothetical protein